MTKTRSDNDDDNLAKAEKAPRKQWRKPAFTRLSAALAEVGVNVTSDGGFTAS